MWEPTLASNIPGLPAASGGVQHFYSVEEMSETIPIAPVDSWVRDRLRHAGLARAAEFNWERWARQTLRFFVETSANYGR